MSRSIAYTSSPLLTSRAPVWRSKLIVAMIALGFGVLAARAVYIQVIENEFFKQKGAVRFGRTLDLPANRGRVLDNEDKGFVWLKRQVDLSVAKEVMALGIKGIHQREEYKRQYPEGEAASHVVGFTNVEDIGQEGIELAFNKDLAGRAGSRLRCLMPFRPLCNAGIRVSTPPSRAGLAATRDAVEIPRVH